MSKKDSTIDTEQEAPEAADAPESDDNASPFAEFIDYGDERTTITFRNVKFSFPASRAKWPTRAMQAFQHDSNADGLELLLGAEQWDLFNEVAPLMEDFYEFIPIFAEAAGFVSYTKGK